MAPARPKSLRQVQFSRIVSPGWAGHTLSTQGRYRVTAVVSVARWLVTRPEVVILSSVLNEETRHAFSQVGELVSLLSRVSCELDVIQLPEASWRLSVKVNTPGQVSLRDVSTEPNRSLTALKSCGLEAQMYDRSFCHQSRHIRMLSTCPGKVRHCSRGFSPVPTKSDTVLMPSVTSS